MVIQGEQRTEGTSHPAVRSDAALCLGHLRGARSLCCPSRSCVTVTIPNALSHRRCDDKVRPQWSVFLTFCKPGSKDVCNSGFSDKIMLTKVTVFCASSA